MAESSRADRFATGVLTNTMLRLLNFALSMVAVRMLVDAVGKDHYGLFTLSTTLIGYFALLGMGLPGGLLKFISECKATGDTDRMSRLASSAYAFYLGVGVATSTAMFLMAFYGLGLFRIRPEDIPVAQNLLVMMGLWGLVSWPSQTYSQILMGLQEWKRNNVAAAFQTMTLNGGYVLLAWFRAPVEGAALCLALSQAVLFLQTRRLVTQAEPHIRIRVADFDWATFRSLTNFSIWLMVATLAGLLIYQTQNLLAGIFISATAVTYYSVLATPLMAVREINGLVLSAALPAVSEASAAKDKGFLEELLLRGSRLNIAVTVTLSMSIFALAEPAVALWMGPDFANQANVTRILIAGYAASAAFSMIGQVMMGLGHVRLLASFALGGAIFTMLCSLVLVDRFGIVGLAVGSAATSFLLPFLFVRPYFRKLGLSFRRFAWGVLLPVYGTLVPAGAALTAAVHFLPPLQSPWLKLGVCLAGGGFLGLVALLGAITQEDRRKAWQLLLRSGISLLKRKEAKSTGSS